MNCSQTYSMDIPHRQPLADRRMEPQGVQKRWYAVQTRSNFEKRIAHELYGRGVDAFLPTLTESRQWNDRKKIVDMPLFRGYLFVHLTDSLDSRWTVLRSTGVVRILGRGAEAEPVPEPEIDSIRKLLHAGVPLAPHSYLREGVRVRIRHGALQGVEGIFLRNRDSSRLVISVDLLSQSVVTEIDAANVELVGDPPNIAG